MSQPFFTTHWTQVLAARGKTPEARQALSDLCAAYYVPVLTFLRRSTPEEDKARDLAHEFFAKILEREGLEGANPESGRFRTYLLGAVKHFLANHFAAARRAKRGGGIPHESIGPATETSPGLEIADQTSLPPDELFDREWAVQILERALSQLAEESERQGNRQEFEILKPWLTGLRTDSQAQAAQALAISEGALRVAIHRLRRKFRHLVKSEIAQTVGPDGNVQEELNHLITVLAQT